MHKRLAHSRCSRNGRFHYSAQLDSHLTSPYKIFRDAGSLQAHSTLLKTNLRAIKTHHLMPPRLPNVVGIMKQNKGKVQLFSPA